MLKKSSELTTTSWLITDVWRDTSISSDASAGRPGSSSEGGQRHLDAAESDPQVAQSASPSQPQRLAHALLVRAAVGQLQGDPGGGGQSQGLGVEVAELPGRGQLLLDQTATL